MNVTESIRGSTPRTCFLNDEVTHMVQLERLTLKERITVQKQILKGGNTLFNVWRNDDDTWACDVSGLIFEAHTFGDLCRELAFISETA